MCIARTQIRQVAVLAVWSICLTSDGPGRSALAGGDIENPEIAEADKAALRVRAVRDWVMAALTPEERRAVRAADRDPPPDEPSTPSSPRWRVAGINVNGPARSPTPWWPVIMVAVIGLVVLICLVCAVIDWLTASVPPDPSATRGGTSGESEPPEPAGANTQRSRRLSPGAWRVLLVWIGAAAFVILCLWPPVYVIVQRSDGPVYLSPGAHYANYAHFINVGRWVLWFAAIVVVTAAGLYTARRR